MTSGVGKRKCVTNSSLILIGIGMERKMAPTGELSGRFSRCWVCSLIHGLQPSLTHSEHLPSLLVCMGADARLLAGGTNVQGRRRTGERKHGGCGAVMLLLLSLQIRHR